ncbi:MAG: type II toxin-antitoxin system YoeB family toxin [Cyanobacteria bacterium J06642_3]
MLKVIFADSALKDYREFKQKNPKVFKRINRLLQDIKETPFSGIGKPEPLKHNWTGCAIFSKSPVVEDDELRVCAASRRITQEHRLVYKITEGKILVAQCKFHY